ncbi:MAG TPA: endonuclease/exonuclease/phosphatase family protein [Candidatus Hydrogenedentes bacterium]|nr:endonuclease/exonuclease/phosphatase family protein [Candidatus Hydrogenedentota bacterium]
MRAATCLLLAAVLSGIFGCAGRAEEPVTLRVLTFNVLVDWETKEAVPPWSARRDLCIQVVREADPDLIGFQETSPAQVDFLRESLPGYGMVGAVALTEDDLAYLTEKLPLMAALGVRTFTDAMLFYKEAVFEKVDEGHWWLCTTPEKLAMDLGNAFPRIMVWARLRHKATGREMYAINTHFDNTMPSQVRMAALAHEWIDQHLDKSLPMVFTGDFNTDPNRGDYARLTESPWRDAYLASPLASETGHDNNVPTSLHGNTRIDHVFYRGAALDAKEWRRVESPDPSKNLSDHYPVFAVLEWR